MRIVWARAIAGLTLAVLIAAALAAASGCGAAGNVHQIEMQNLKFNPETITIKKGETVHWVNLDQTAHDPTSLDFNLDNPDQSPPTAWRPDKAVNPDASFDHTFDETGTFEYFCQIHNYMKAKVVVEE